MLERECYILLDFLKLQVYNQVGVKRKMLSFSCWTATSFMLEFLDQSRMNMSLHAILNAWLVSRMNSFVARHHLRGRFMLHDYTLCCIERELWLLLEHVVFGFDEHFTLFLSIKTFTNATTLMISSITWKF